MLIYDDIRFKLNNVKPKLDDLKLALDLEKAKTEIEELEKKAAEPEFWNDPGESQKVLQRTKQLKDKVANYAALYTMFEDVVTTIEMAEEMEDESLVAEAGEEIEKLKAMPDAVFDEITPAQEKKIDRMAKDTLAELHKWDFERSES